MSTQTPTPDKRTASSSTRTDPRPDHIVLGIDNAGATHHFYTPTETVYIIGVDGLEARFPFDETPARCIEDWMAAVERKRGWAQPHIAADLVTALVAQMER